MWKKTNRGRPQKLPYSLPTKKWASLSLNMKLITINNKKKRQQSDFKKYETYTAKYKTRQDHKVKSNFLLYARHTFKTK